ncbi:hypothetical protein L9F63_001334 [Diploptera punctata]|uniref:Gustatory receptor n=1 Tax=Diploptera punctata TaxID=6984 RepID=A0AAD8EJ62_DIPPU|nr:hypothetical protein L9F63_001334 [Diploptera punctata]
MTIVTKITDSSHSEIIRLYYMLKLTGLLTFSFNQERYLSVSCILYILWSLCLLSMMLIGIVSTFTRREFFKTSNTTEIINYKLLLPIHFIVTFVIILLQNTIKRSKSISLISDLIKIDGIIPSRPNISSGYKITKLIKLIIMTILVFIHLIILMFESWYWRKKTNICYEILVRLCKLFSMALLMIYISVVNIVEIKLSAITKDFILYNLRPWNEIVTTYGKNSTMAHFEMFKFKRIQKSREEYFLIYTLTQKINSVFSCSILLLIVMYYLTFINSIYTVYELQTSGEDFGNNYFDKKRILLVTFWVVHSVSSLFSLSYYTHVASEKAKDLVDHVQKQLLKQKSSAELEQLNQFATQLHYKRIEFTAVGFPLNLVFFCNMIMSACTYLLVIIQFK